MRFPLFAFGVAMPVRERSRELSRSVKLHYIRFRFDIAHQRRRPVPDRVGSGEQNRVCAMHIPAGDRLSLVPD